MKNIKKIYESDIGSCEVLNQYYNESWKCQLGEDENVPLTLVVQTTDMLEATGEDEFKDYPVVPEICIINKNCHKSISEDMAGEDWEGEFSNLYDVSSYCGFVYCLQQFLDTDAINKNIIETLKIGDAALATYECRFTGETKTYPKFKTHEAAQEFCEKLVLEYGNMFMALIGFALDRPVNLVGETGWKTIEMCHQGINNK